MRNCQEIMTENPVCCLASDKVYEIAQRMQTEDVGALPVVENHACDDRFYVKKAVNWALRDIGKRNEFLRPHAFASALRHIERLDHACDVPGSGRAGSGEGPGRRPGAAAEHGGDARIERLVDLLRADEMDMRVEAAGGQAIVA